MKSKKILSLLLAFSMVASLSSCNDKKNSSGGKKDSKKIDVYYETVDVSDTDLSNSNILTATPDKYYYMMYSSESDADNGISRVVLDLNSGEMSEEQGSYDEKMIFADENCIITSKYDENYNSIIEKTDLKDGSVLTAKTESIWMAECDSNGNVYVFSGEKLSIFDPSLNLIKELNVSDLKDMPNLETDSYVASMCVSGEGTVYFLVSSEKACSIYRVESDEAVNITGDITTAEDNYGYGKIMFDKSGNIILPCNSDTLYIDIIDPKDGHTLGMYEKEDAYQFIGTSEKYDLIYMKEDGIYGSDYEGNSEESLLPENSGIGPNTSYGNIIGNKLYMTVYDSDRMMQLCEVDAKTGKVSMSECPMINTATVSDDGTLFFVSYEYDDDGAAYTLYKHENNTENTEICSLSENYGDDTYIEDLDIDDKGNFIVTVLENNNTYVNVYDSNGNHVKKIDLSSTNITYDAHLMQNEKSEFFLCTETGSVYSIDIENEKCTKTDAKAVNMFVNGFDGNNGYDFYYCDMAGVYGYNFEKDKSDKIAEWTDMEGTTNYYDVYVVDADTILAAEGKKLVKADQAKIDEMNSKQIISMAVLSGDMIKSYVDKFNEENDDVRIVLNDYMKSIKFDTEDLSNVDERELLKQVTDAFEQDVMNGDIPDIVMLDNMDVSSLALKGFFADMKSFMDKDPDIDFSDYNSAVADELTYNGKMFAVSAFMDIGLLSSSREIEKMDYDAFFSLKNDGNKLIDEWMTYELESMLYSSYVNDFVDIEKKTCDFSNSTFTDLINFINDNDLTQAAYMEKMNNEDFVYSEEDQPVLSNAYVYNISQYAMEYGSSSQGEKKYLTGYPSAEGSKGFFRPAFIFGIPEKSDNKDGAWKFIRQFLTEELMEKENDDDSLQMHLFDSYHSCMKSIDEKSIDKQVKELKEYNSFKLTDADVKKYKEIYSSPLISNILNYDIVSIIMEEAKKFYSGEVSAENTAKALQSKVSLYMSEIS